MIVEVSINAKAPCQWDKVSGIGDGRHVSDSTMVVIPSCVSTGNQHPESVQLSSLFRKSMIETVNDRFSLKLNLDAHWSIHPSRVASHCCEPLTPEENVRLPYHCCVV